MNRKLFVSLICALYLFPAWLCAKVSEKRIVFCGDTNFAESYQERFARWGQGNVLVDLGYDYSIEEIGTITRRADYAVANLETVITTQRKSPHLGKKSYIHHSHPVKTPKALLRWGIDVVSLGNNHTMDYGLEGLKETITSLKKYSMPSFGGGLSTTCAARAHLTTINVGKGKIPLLLSGAFEYRPRYQRKYSFYAQGKLGGVNGWTDESGPAQIKSFRQNHKDAFIVVFPHWGKNYHWRSYHQQRLAHKLIDAGADLILGHGAHMLQEIEQYKGKWIVYSLGNFVFNTKGRYDKDKKPPFSLIAEVSFAEVSKKLDWFLRLYPIFCNNRKTHFRSRFVNKGEMSLVKKELLRLEKRSSALRKLLELKSDEVGNYFEFPGGTLLKTE